jgi:hypothetical protein
MLGLGKDGERKLARRTTAAAEFTTTTTTIPKCKQRFDIF